MRVIKDPLHGSIQVEEHELKIIDTQEFQRLRKIKQLAMSYLVYPGANHTRFEHSLGTMHLTQKICESLNLNTETTGLLRILGLLHDIGHGPFSHDSDEIIKQYFGSSHEELGLSKIKDSQLKEIIENAGFSITELGKIFLGKGYGEIITSEIGSDRMDYLVRDAHNTGVAYGIIDTDRIISTVKWHGSKLVIEEGSLEAAESLLIARFLMFSTVYLHHTARIASSMLKKSILLALAEKSISPVEYLDFDDNSLIMALKKSSGRKLIELIERRYLYKRVHEIKWNSLNEKGKALFLDPKKRTRAEGEISVQANLSDEEVVLNSYNGYGKEKNLHILRGGKEIPVQEASELVKSITKDEGNRLKVIIAGPREKSEALLKASKDYFENYLLGD